MSDPYLRLVQKGATTLGCEIDCPEWMSQDFEELGFFIMAGMFPNISIKRLGEELIINRPVKRIDLLITFEDE